MCNKEARVIALEDQAWMDIEKYLPDIKRIAFNGIETERDSLLAIKCCCMVGGRVNIILAQRDKESNQ